MSLARLGAFDLNLLLVFDVLLAERNVTRAAKRLGLSQSAVSNALARLRDALDDPVLVRAGSGMVPTARALALGRDISDGLHRIGGAITTWGIAAFDPTTARRTFTIAATDYVQFVLLGRLVERIRSAAPGVTVQVVSPTKDFPLNGLETGALDLILASNRAAPVPRGLHRRWLFRDHLVCLLRADHPTTNAPLTLERYLELDHIEALPIGSVGLADEILAGLGHTRRIALTVPNFMIAPYVVMQSGCCFTLANRIALPLTKLLPVRRRPLPFTTPSVAIGAFWHDRVHKDAAHRWLRRLIIDTASELEGDGRASKSTGT
jgi:DNA-binding transcriptional LysR family regulator